MDSKKLKVAVQIYGHLRTFKECFPNLKKNLLDLYDCEIFIHTWDTLDHTTKAWHSLNENKDVIDLDAEFQKTVIETFNPTRIVFEKQDKKDLGNLTNNGQSYSIFGISCMQYTMRKANELRLAFEDEQKVTYDFVLVTRADIFLSTPFIIQTFIEKFDDSQLRNKLFLTGCQYSQILNDIRYFGGKDLLFFGKPSLVSDLFKNEDKVFKDVLNLKTDPADLNILEYFFYKMIEYSKCEPLFCNYSLGKEYVIKRLHQAPLVEAHAISVEKNTDGVITQLKKLLPAGFKNILKKILGR